MFTRPGIPMTSRAWSVPLSSENGRSGAGHLVGPVPVPIHRCALEIVPVWAGKCENYPEIGLHVHIYIYTLYVDTCMKIYRYPDIYIYTLYLWIHIYGYISRDIYTVIYTVCRYIDIDIYIYIHLYINVYIRN